MYSSTDGYDSVETEQGDVIVSKQAPYSARFFYHDQYLVNIIDVSDKEILLKIVENIQ